MLQAVLIKVGVGAVSQLLQWFVGKKVIPFIVDKGIDPKVAKQLADVVLSKIATDSVIKSEYFGHGSDDANTDDAKFDNAVRIFLLRSKRELGCDVAYNVAETIVQRAYTAWKATGKK